MDKLKLKTIEFEKNEIIKALKATQSIAEASRFLGVSRSMLSQKIKRYKIPVGLFCSNCKEKFYK